MIRKFGGKKVVVLGDVARPGVYTFTGDVRVVEALALAGDCTKYAVKNNILIIRGDIHKNPTVISSNVLAFLKDARLSENVLVEPQDVIFVPRSLIGNINAFVETIAPIVDMVYKGSTVKTAVEGF
jgi:polysaccharide export outer membrane protein